MTNIFNELTATEVEPVEDGSYTGVIEEIKRDTTKYDYTRYKVQIDKKKMSLTVSYPTNISYLPDGKPSSQHGKFLVKMGIVLKDNKKLGDSILSLKGTKVQFLVQQVTNNNGTFSEIVKTSVKPSN